MPHLVTKSSRCDAKSPTKLTREVTLVGKASGRCDCCNGVVIKPQAFASPLEPKTPDVLGDSHPKRPTKFPGEMLWTYTSLHPEVPQRRPIQELRMQILNGTSKPRGRG